MKILYDLSVLGSTYRTGIPQYTIALARALQKQNIGLMPTINEKTFPSTYANQFIEEAIKRYASPLAAPNRNVLNRLKAGVFFRAKRFLKPFIRAHNVVNRREWVDFYKPRLQHVLCHNLDYKIAELPLCFTIYDLSPLAMPEVHEQKNIDSFKRAIEKLSGLIEKQFPVRIIAISEFTKKEIKKYLGDDIYSLTRVTHLAAKEESQARELSGAKSQLELEPKTILAVGTMEPRKNLVRLLEAFSIVAEKDKTVRLVLVGGRGWKNESLDEALAKNLYRDRIKVLGYVSDVELKQLYQSATVFCYPSLYEGFGLPVLEAATEGQCVVTSQDSSMSEILGGLGIYVNPLDVGSIADGILRGLNTASNANKELLKQRAHEFSWDKTATDTIRVYKELGT